MSVKKDNLEVLRADAWLGDAVLELYVRTWILEKQGAVDADMKMRFTCNQFLNHFGQPTKVEAEIGRCYKDEGMDAAFAWIKTRLEPLFLKQEAKRKRTHQ